MVQISAENNVMLLERERYNIFCIIKYFYFIQHRISNILNSSCSYLRSLIQQNFQCNAMKLNCTYKQLHIVQRNIHHTCRMFETWKDISILFVNNCYPLQFIEKLMKVLWRIFALQIQHCCVINQTLKQYKWPEVKVKVSFAAQTLA